MAPRYFACYKPCGVVCSARQNVGVNRAYLVLISDWLKGAVVAVAPPPLSSSSSSSSSRSDVRNDGGGVVAAAKDNDDDVACRQRPGVCLHS